MCIRGADAGPGPLRVQDPKGEVAVGAPRPGDTLRANVPSKTPLIYINNFSFSFSEK